jgi:hypothetical protein
MSRRAKGPGDPQPVRAPELPKHPQASKRLPRWCPGQVTRSQRVTHGLRVKIGQDLEGEDAMLLGAVPSPASPGRTRRGRGHVDERLGDDLTDRIEYLKPDVVALSAGADGGLKPHAASGDRACQTAGQVYLGVGCPGWRGERLAVLVECLNVAVQIAAGISGDREAERDGTLDQRLGAAGEDFEGHPSSTVAVLDCSVELAVSELLSSAFMFRCVRVDDRAERNNFEKWLIATMAACPVCRPSDSWLGRYAYPDLVRSSGLWNVHYIGGQPATDRQLRRFEELIGMTPRDAGPGKQLDLSRTMLVIPCSGSKDGVADPGLPQVSVADLLGTAECKLLEHGRQLAFDRPGTALNLSSPLRPALAYYTGQPYATEGVLAALAEAIRHGLQCLIISAGYGVLRAEEPIHRYNAHMAQTRSVWARRLPAILADYVRRQHIDRSFVLLSRQYAACVPQLTQTEQRMVPTFTRGRDPGSAIREVPARIGSELSRLLPALLRGLADTRGSARQ